MLRWPIPFLCALAAAAAPAGCHKPAVPEKTEVRNAWVRLPPVIGHPAAAYFTLLGGRDPARLIAVESPKVATIELHGMAMQGGMMAMPRLDGAEVLAGGKTAFAPGGNHAMLFGIDPRLRPGDRVPLSFRFARGAPITVDAQVVAAGAAPY